jgi:hypothetical protein
MSTREDKVLENVAHDDDEAADESVPTARRLRTKDKLKRETVAASLQLLNAQLTISTRSRGVIVGELVGRLDADGRAVVSLWGAGRVEVSIDDVVSVTSIEASRDVYRRISEAQRVRFGKDDGNG